VKQVTKIASSLTMQLSIEPSIAAMRRCVASALDVALSLVHRVSFRSTERRLSHAWMAHRRAQEERTFTVDLEVISPDSVSSVILVAMASGLAVDGSEVQNRLMNSLSEGFDIKASLISQLVEPHTFQTVLVSDNEGSIWGTSDDGPITGKDQSDSGFAVGVIIGYIAGGVLALCLVGVGVVCMARNRTVKFEV